MRNNWVDEITIKLVPIMKFILVIIDKLLLSFAEKPVPDMWRTA